MAIWKAIVGSGVVGAIVGGLYYWWNNKDEVTPDKHAIPVIQDAVPDVMNQTKADIPIKEDGDELPDIEQDPDIEVTQVDVYDQSTADTSENNQPDDPPQVLPFVLSPVSVVDAYETYEISDQSAADTSENNQPDDPPQVLPRVSAFDTIETYDPSMHTKHSISDQTAADTVEDNQSAYDPSQVLKFVLPPVSAVDAFETYDISEQSADAEPAEDNQSADDPSQVLPPGSTVDAYETYDISEQSADAEPAEDNQSADDPSQVLPPVSTVDAYETGEETNNKKEEETTFTPSEYVEAYHNLPNKPHILEQVKHFFEEKIGLVFFIDSTLINDITTRARIIFMNQTDARKAFSLDGATFLGSKIKIKVFIDGYQVPCDMETSEAPPVEQNGILDHSYFPSIAPYAPISMEPGGEYIIASNFPNSMTAVELIEFFQTHVGPVNSCGMFTTDPINGDRLNFSKARISFRNRGHAEMALIVLDNSMLLGQPLEIQLFIDERRFYREQVIFHPPESSGVYQQHVHISGLPPSTTGAQIIEHFWKLVGPVKSVGFELDARGFATNGNAMLVFQSPFDNLKALCYDYSVFNGSQLKMLLITYEPSYEPSEIMK